MPPVLEWLWAVSWQGGLLAAVVWVIARLACRAPAAWRHAIWVVVVVKFLAPPLVPFPAELAFWRTAEFASRVAPVPGRDPASPRVEQAPDSSEPVPNSQALVGKTNEDGRFVQARGPDRVSLLVVAWLAGVLAMTALLVVRYVRQSSLIRGSVAADGTLMSLVAEGAEAMGLHRVPEVRLSGRACTPMLLGILRPLLVLPREITDSCNKPSLRAMLLHELAHIRRWDMAYVLIYQFAKALFFFHPFLWLAGRHLRKERELACDELVLSRSVIPREEYAAGYVSALRLASGVPAMATSLAMAEPFEMEKRRLEMILRSTSQRLSARWMAALAFVAVVGLPTFGGVGRRALLSEGTRSSVGLT